MELGRANIALLRVLCVVVLTAMLTALVYTGWVAFTDYDRITV